MLEDHLCLANLLRCGDVLGYESMVKMSIALYTPPFLRGNGAPSEVQQSHRE